MALLGSCSLMALAGRVALSDSDVTANNKTTMWDYWWEAHYGACGNTCGEGSQPVLKTLCMQSTGLLSEPEPVPMDHCKDKDLPLPRACTDLTGCEWRVGDRPEGDCGFASALCWSGRRGVTVDARLCQQASSIGLPSAEVWRSQHAVVVDGCAALGERGLRDVCVVSMNYDKGKVSTTTVKEKEPASIFKECGHADIVVLATQELISNVWDHFRKYVIDGATGTGYEHAAACGRDISPAVVVFVKAEKRRFLAPAHDECISLPDDDGSTMNTKGSEVGSINSVIGVIAFASTHAARGGTIMPVRVQEVQDAAKKLVGSGARFIAWGGDFNPRTAGVADNEALQAAGTTHPEPGDEQGDEHPYWSKEFNPREAQRLLAMAPDVLGREGESFDDALAEVAKGRIVQAPGLRSLCPTYRKKAKAGTMKALHIATTVSAWKPGFACQSEGGPVEYYGSELDGQTKWDGKKNRAPSWTDRLLVSPELGCKPVRKIYMEDDHDVLLTTCIPSFVVPS